MYIILAVGWGLCLILLLSEKIKPNKTIMAFLFVIMMISNLNLASNKFYLSDVQTQQSKLEEQQVRLLEFIEQQKIFQNKLNEVLESNE
ncbi:hypothetical protein ABE073_05060 [Lederbergia citrisecunda]|uniref:hypothetical protein n=1 Tax=Lederbergia citrisecunda TaxID=2833583 RepID=UPI003D2C76F1